MFKMLILATLFVTYGYSSDREGNDLKRSYMQKMVNPEDSKNKWSFKGDKAEKEVNPKKQKTNNTVKKWLFKDGKTK